MNFCLQVKVTSESRKCLKPIVCTWQIGMVFTVEVELLVSKTITFDHI